MKDPETDEYRLKFDKNAKTLEVRSPSGQVIVLDDGEDAITLRTRGGQTLVIRDTDKSVTVEDGNANIWVLNGQGIRLSSPGDIVLEAKGRVMLEGGAGVVVKSPGDVKVDCLNLEMRAAAGLKAHGAATAELSASGMTKVVGAMVMIN